MSRLARPAVLEPTSSVGQMILSQGGASPAGVQNLERADGQRVCMCDLACIPERAFPLARIFRS